jgi:hypothetical protein
MKLLKLLLIWDSNFTKVTPSEAEHIKAAEENDFVDGEDID